MKKNCRFLVSIFFSLFIVVLFYFKRIVFIKYYPPIVNFSIFLVFFTSLFQKETIIQKFAKMIDGELPPLALRYTRNLTYLWSIFLFVNFSISLVTVFLSDKIWMIYNGCLSYVFVGTFFVVEYIVRIIFKKRHNLP